MAKKKTIVKCAICSVELIHDKPHFHSGNDGSITICLKCVALATGLKERDANHVWKFFRSITPVKYAEIGRDAALPSNVAYQVRERYARTVGKN